jgi:hypothetical protein
MFDGNLAGVGHSIYDPTTYDPASGTRKPFPNNVIPPSQITSVARNLLKSLVSG